MFDQKFVESLALGIYTQIRRQLSETTVRRLLDLEAAAEYLGRSPEAVKKLISRGRIPVTRLDGKIQIDRYALDKLISESTYTQA
jgi:excisionase family DNA binding protein